MEGCGDAFHDLHEAVCISTSQVGQGALRFLPFLIIACVGGAGPEGDTEEGSAGALAEAAGEGAASCISDSLTTLDMDGGASGGATATAAAAARSCHSSGAEAREREPGSEGAVIASVSGDTGEHRTEEGYEEEDDDDKLPLYENPNRRFVQHEEVSDSSSDNEGGS